MRLFVHCGFHKTATTTFQNLILENAWPAPAGFCFRFRRHSPEMQRLHDSLRHYWATPGAVALKRIRGRLEELRADILSAGAHTVFVQMESLCGAVPDHRPGAEIYPHASAVLREIASVFAAERPVFLFSTREPAGWISSLHNHRVRTRGLRIPASEFADLEKFRGFGWDDLVARIMEGIDAPFHVAAMEDDLARPLGPGSAFLDLLDPDGSLTRDWHPVAPANEGLDARALALALHPALAALPSLLRKRVVNRYDRRLKAQGS